MRGRAAVTKRQRNLGPDPFRVLNDVVRPETKDTPAFALPRSGATPVYFDLKSMMVAVDLDHELSRYAGKICEVRTDRVLSAELDAGQAAIPKKLPNRALRSAAVASQFAGFSGRILVLAQAPLT